MAIDSCSAPSAFTQVPSVPAPMATPPTLAARAAPGAPAALTAPAAPARQPAFNKVSDDMELEVGGGWRKRIVRRKGGASEGQMDVYLTPPPRFVGTKRLRSNDELIKFLAEDVTALDGLDPDTVNFQKTFQVKDGGTKVKLLAAIEYVRANVGENGRTDMANFPWRGSSYKSNKKKARPAASCISNAKVPKIALMWKKFSDREKAYLEKEHSKVNFPDAARFDKLAVQLRTDVASVARWFRRRNGLEEEDGDDELETENDEEVGFPSRPTKKFDITDVPGICHLVVEEEEDDCLAQEPCSVEWDNAELDLEAEYLVKS